jgi:hypothetical protein
VTRQKPARDTLEDRSIFDRLPTGILILSPQQPDLRKIAPSSTGPDIRPWMSWPKPAASTACSSNHKKEAATKDPSAAKSLTIATRATASRNPSKGACSA